MDSPDRPGAAPTIVVVGGRVIDPSNGRDETADVVIESGRITAVGRGAGGGVKAEVTIDAAGKIVCPGLIDPHVHLREPGNTAAETIETGTRAAAAGGFTAVCCMPNTTPCLDSPDVMRHIAARTLATAHSRVFCVVAATPGRKGERVGELELLAREGAVGFSDDGDAIASAQVQLRVFEALASIGGVFMQHCQEPTLTVGASMHAGRVAARLGLTGWPAIAETLIIERDVALLRSLAESPGGLGGLRYHVQHLSAGASVEVIRRARAEGLPVSAEASPHHLLFTDSLIESGPENGDACVPAYWTLAKMNPPLRERGDVDAVRAGVADGTITVLATDHAPHTSDAKSQPFERAPFGITGLETALAAYAEALVHTGVIDWAGLIELLTINPAKLCGLESRGLGSLTVGGPGDVTVIDPDEAWTVGRDDLAGKSMNTPMLGRSMRGRAIAAIAGGRVRMRREGGRYTFAPPGMG